LGPKTHVTENRDIAMRDKKLMSAIGVLRYRYRRYSKKHKGEVLDELQERFSVDRNHPAPLKYHHLFFTGLELPT
jgi:hypothetical protein